MKSFNFSPSSLGIWLDSPLWGYYQYCSDEEEDTKTLSCYWKSGNVAHETLEHYHKHRDRNKAIEYFNKAWEEKGLFSDPDFKGRPLSKGLYLDATIYGMDLIDTQYEVLESEMKLEFPFREGYMKKGFLDILAIHDGKLTIMDFKTSASIDNSPKFRNQVLFYAHLYWVKTGKIINHARIEYLKLKEAKPYEFTDEEVINFENNVLVPIYDMIQKNGDNEFLYELGKYDSPFNSHKKKCQAQADLRTPNNILAIRKDNKLHFPNGFPNLLHRIFDKYFSYKAEYWENVYGKKTRKEYPVKFLKKNTLPFGFVHEINRVLSKYNERAGSSYKLIIIDKRDQNVVNAKYQTKFEESSKELRYYQEEAIKQISKWKNLCVQLPTSSGKTYTASQFIKNDNRRSLFIVHRIELANQTKDEFEEQLGIKVGMITEGNLETDKQVTICSIQSISAILKRNDKTSEQLRIYLYNVAVAFVDEVQMASKLNKYDELISYMPNVDVVCGLSASPYRADASTLALYAIIGYPEYVVTKNELEEAGYITPIKVKFIDVPKRSDDKFETYHQNYDFHITEYDYRNSLVKKIADKFKDKHKILILVSKISHGEKLKEMIDGSYFLHGTTPKKERDEMFKTFKNTRDIKVLISVTSLAGAGWSINDLSVIINASANTSIVMTTQIIGRGGRVDERFPQSYYFDFKDDGLFKSAYYKRRRQLLAEGYSLE